MKWTYRSKTAHEVTSNAQRTYSVALQQSQTDSGYTDKFSSEPRGGAIPGRTSGTDGVNPPPCSGARSCCLRASRTGPAASFCMIGAVVDALEKA